MDRDKTVEIVERVLRQNKDACKVKINIKKAGDLSVWADSTGTISLTASPDADQTMDNVSVGRSLKIQLKGQQAVSAVHLKQPCFLS